MTKTPRARVQAGIRLQPNYRDYLHYLADNEIRTPSEQVEALLKDHAWKNGYRRLLEEGINAATDE